MTHLVKNLIAKCGRPGFDPWVGKIPWRREWLPIPVFLPGESHGQRSLVVQGVAKGPTGLSNFHFHFSPSETISVIRFLSTNM